MTETAVIVPIICPGCFATLNINSPGRTRCPQCSWTGDIYVFSPRVQVIEPAKLALPEEAKCLHHPRKKAIAVCAGSGDYICSLCAIEMNGQTYSAAYLDGAGKAIAIKAFDRTLPRPDTLVGLYLILCFIPVINYVMLPFAFVWIPHAVFLLVKSNRMRRENELFRALVGRGRIIALWILLCLFAAVWTFSVIALIVAIMLKRW